MQPVEASRNNDANANFNFMLLFCSNSLAFLSSKYDQRLTIRGLRTAANGFTWLSVLGCVPMRVSDDLLLQEEFIHATVVAQALAAINSFREIFPLPIISRPSGRRPLCYSVIDGHQISDHLPEIQNLHKQATAYVRNMFGESLEPLADKQVACNINITQPGGSYRYHYDRNAVTAILYLNETSGGETECYPSHRLNLMYLQREVDRVFENPMCRRVFGRQILVRPRTGRLLVMRGDRCLHSVREVHGDADRINVVMSYDVKGARYANGDRLNSYLYSSALHRSDPNYVE